MEITEREILNNLLGTECLGCGKKKKSKMSHCRKCYFLLPPELRKDLYKKFNSGYQVAFRKSIEILKEEVN